MPRHVAAASSSPDTAAERDLLLISRADLYAWGIVAYELLAGSHPFADKTSPQQLMAAHFTETPVPLSTPPVPLAIADLVVRCLAKDPADRPASAAAVLAVLDGAALDGSRRGAGPVAVPRAAFVGMAFTLLAVAAAALVWRARGDPFRGEPPSLKPPLLAVLPFEMSGVAGGIAADSMFADGLGDAITGKLARLSGLRVIDRTSVRSIKDAAARPQAAGRTLGADYVLRATLRWARGTDGQARVQVSPVLVRVADGTTRWAGEPIVVTPADAFTVQGTLATEVADVREPAAAEAWGEAADALQIMGQIASSTTLIDSAAVLARHSLALDPGNAQGVRTIAIYEITHERVQAQRAVAERAVRAYPSSAELWALLAIIESETGQADRAWPAALAALQLAPRSTRIIDRTLRVALA